MTGSNSKTESLESKLVNTPQPAQSPTSKNSSVNKFIDHFEDYLFCYSILGKRNVDDIGVGRKGLEIPQWVGLCAV